MENISNIIIMKTLKNLFDLIKKVSKEKRVSNKKLDGKKFWQPIKNSLDKSSFVGKWKKISSKEIMEMPEFYIDGNGKQSIIEINHFIIQTVRIPSTEKPSLKKIGQVALNIGQYLGSKTSKDRKLPYSKMEDFLPSKYDKVLLKDILDEKEINFLIKYLK